MTLKELKAKWPLDAQRMHTKPFKNCPACSGTGERLDSREHTVWCPCMTMKGWPEDKVVRILQPIVEQTTALITSRRKAIVAAAAPPPKRRQPPLSKSKKK